MSSRELARLRLEEVGFVFQAYNLLPVLTALENAEFPMLLQGVDAEERQARVRELFARTGMEGLEDRRRASCPAASSSGSRSCVRLPAVRPWCSRTSRRRTSTRSPAKRSSMSWAS